MEEITTSWHSYPKSLAIGHRYVADILKEDIIVEEKVDGSQFSFGIFGGEIRCRSKGHILNLLVPEKMFIQAVESVKQMAEKGLLTDGYTYRGEYLAKPKHNALAYARIPKGHIIGFDVNTGHEKYMTYDEKVAEFNRIGLEVVPCIHSGRIDDLATFRTFLDRESVLGGQKIEGVVIKNYGRFTQDGKAMMAKFVSEAFKEVHSAEWKDANPGSFGIIEQLIYSYKTPARWNKAIQALKENGNWTGTPEDIGHLIKMSRADIEAECRDEIAKKLFDWAWPQIQRGVTGGLPEWYKEELLKQSFATEEVPTSEVTP